MVWQKAILAVLLALPLGAETAEIMYYNFFGDYLVEDSYQIDIEISSTSLKDIQNKLEKFRSNSHLIDSDLAIIGYGPKRSPHEFFSATSFVNYQIPLQHVLHHLPEHSSEAKWYIYFIDRSLSHYVRARKDHHWASPFRWLAQIGLQDLHYFGPF